MINLALKLIEALLEVLKMLMKLEKIGLNRRWRVIPIGPGKREGPSAMVRRR